MFSIFADSAFDGASFATASSSTLNLSSLYVSRFDWKYYNASSFVSKSPFAKLSRANDKKIERKNEFFIFTTTTECFMAKKEIHCSKLIIFQKDF